MPPIEPREAFRGILVRDLRLVERLVRRVRELARAFESLQDVRVGDDAVADELDRRARQVAQVLVEDRLDGRHAER